MRTDVQAFGHKMYEAFAGQMSMVFSNLIIAGEFMCKKDTTYQRPLYPIVALQPDTMHAERASQYDSAQGGAAPRA